MEPELATARSMLDNADGIAQSVRSADTIRRNVYRIQAFVVPLCVAPFDVLRPTLAAAVCVIVIAVGLALTIREVRRSRVVNREAMVSYTVVIGSWSLLWVLLMTVVGPWLGDQTSIGWTLTGIIGTIPFLAGLVWERRR